MKKLIIKFFSDFIVFSVKFIDIIKPLFIEVKKKKIFFFYFFSNIFKYIDAQIINP